MFGQVDARRLELVDCSDRLVRVPCNVVRSSIVREAELTLEVNPGPVVAERIVELTLEKEILHVTLGHTRVRLRSDHLNCVVEGVGVGHRSSSSDRGYKILCYS